MGNKNDVVGKLLKFNVLNLKEVKLINASETHLISSLITKIVSEKIHKGDQNSFTRFTSFMESHWATKFVLHDWKKKCKIQIIIMVLYDSIENEREMLMKEFKIIACISL